MSDEPMSENDALAFYTHLGEPATVRDLNAMASLISQALATVVGYMISDYKVPDEEGKRKSIDEAIKLLREIHQFQRTLVKLPELSGPEEQ
jgi:hypothetical protein